MCACVKALAQYLMVRETQWCLTQKLPDSKSEIASLSVTDTSNSKLYVAYKTAKNNPKHLLPQCNANGLIFSKCH